jgi:hypothetical protein
MNKKERIDLQFVSKNVAISVTYFTVKPLDETNWEVSQMLDLFSKKLSQTFIYFVVVKKYIEFPCFKEKQYSYMAS